MNKPVCFLNYVSKKLIGDGSPVDIQAKDFLIIQLLCARMFNGILEPRNIFSSSETNMDSPAHS